MAGLAKVFSPELPCSRASFALLCLWAAGVASSAPVSAAESDGVTGAATNPPLTTIRQFLNDAPAWGEGRLARVQGTVTHSISDKTFFIQQGDAGTYVFHKPTTALRVGELVEVAGYPSLAGAPTLQRCQIRLLGPGQPPEPQTATASEARAGNFHMRLVRVQGVLAPERLRGGHILVLNPGGNEKAFTADLEAFSDLRSFDHLKPGSLLEVTGV